MTDKVFVVTEVASEIGKALALSLAKTGERVVIVAPKEELGKDVLEEIRRSAQDARVELELCDLSIFSSVRNLGEILKSKHDKIDVLIHHAGLYSQKHEVTVDGFEKTFAANYLGPFLLTNLLLERLQAAVQADGAARVLNIVPPAEVPLDLQNLPDGQGFDAAKAFEAASMANLLFTFALARRLEKTGITVNAIDPGSAPGKGSLFSRLLPRSHTKAVEHILRAATAPEFEQVTGTFMQEGQEGSVTSAAQDRDLQERLWRRSEEITQLSANQGVLPVNDPHLE